MRIGDIAERAALLLPVLAAVLTALGARQSARIAEEIAREARAVADAAHDRAVEAERNQVDMALREAVLSQTAGEEE